MKHAPWRLVAVLLLPLLTGQGCLPNRTDVSHPIVNPQPVTVQSQANAQWENMDAGVDRLSYTSTTLDATVIVYRLDPKLFSFKFGTSTGTHGMAEWSAAYPAATLLVNGVYFHDDNFPSGFMVSGGQRVGDRQFDLDKSGVIDFSGETHVLDTSVDAPALNTFTNAAQTYPFYFKGGSPAIKEDSLKPARRSFFGKDKSGFVYIGVIPAAQVSLYQAMEMLGELHVDWANVINLDGGPSTGLIAHTRARSEELPSLFPVPNIIVVTRK
jgi:exopolysaccharide biosynthesis protein